MIILLFGTREEHQTNATSRSHSTVSIDYSSISRNEGKQKHAAFQGWFGQLFGCQDNKPLTKQSKVAERYSLPYTSPLNKPLHPLENRFLKKLFTQE